MDPIQRSSQFSTYAPSEGLSQSHESSDSPLVMDLVPPLPQTSRWEIRAGKEEIAVNGHLLRKIEENSTEARSAFFEFLEKLHISPTFDFLALGGIIEPNLLYGTCHSQPCVADMIPLLECRRSLIDRGGDVTGFELLFNWIIENYLTPERIPLKIPFTFSDAQGNPIGSIELAIEELMQIYGFGLKEPEVFSSAPSERKPLLFYPLENWNLLLVTIKDLNGNCHMVPFSFNSLREAQNPFWKQETREPGPFVDRTTLQTMSLGMQDLRKFELWKRAPKETLQELIDQCTMDPDPNLLNELAKRTEEAAMELPFAQPEEIPFLFDSIALARNLLQIYEWNSSPQPEAQDSPAPPPLSEEERRRQLREEKRPIDE